MFEELPFIIVIFAVSYLFKELVSKKELGPFRTIFLILGFFGVVVHELAHYVFCIACRVPAGELTVKLRNRSGKISPNGKVSLHETSRTSFMQHFLTSMAPLFVCAWLVFWCWEWAFNEELFYAFRIMAGIASISLLLGAAPSQPDFMSILYGYNLDRRYAWFQIALVIISSVLLFLTIQVIQWEFLITLINETLDFLLFLAYYLIIGIIYAGLKYSILGSAWLFKALTSRRKPGQAYKHHEAPMRKTIRPGYYKSYKYHDKLEVEY